jgi:type III restriction enzyme
LEKKDFEISWPNIIRIDHEYRTRLALDLSKVKPLELNAADSATLAEMAPVVEGKPDVTKLTQIDLEDLGRRNRIQTIIFKAASETFDLMKPSWKGNREFLLAQIISLIEDWIASNKVTIMPGLFNQDPLRRRIILTLNMSKLVQHIWEAIRFENTLALIPVFDTERPIRSTGDMRPWFTGKPCEYMNHSHINHCVFDSAWEASEAFELDRNTNVAAWVKNDHLGFEILYVFKGIVRKFRPDFLIRLKNGKMLILEVKGQDSQEHKTKREFLDEWVKAVNAHGGFGSWAWEVSRDPKDIGGLIQKHSRGE